jgi:hypothetical protein
MEKHNSKKSLKTLFGVLSDCLDKMSAIRLTNYLNILLGVHSAKSNFQESFVDKIIFEVTDYYNVKFEFLKSEDNILQGNDLDAMMVLSYSLKTFCNMTNKQVARILCKTVSHTHYYSNRIKNLKKEIAADKKLIYDLQVVNERIKKMIVNTEYRENG